MLTLKHWLAPPVFSDDEIKTRCASLPNTALIISIALALIVIMLLNPASVTLYGWTVQEVFGRPLRAESS